MFIPEKYRGKKALVIGAGKSGAACANLLAAEGFSVLLSDNKPRGRLTEKLKGLDARVKIETGGHAAAGRPGFGFAVKSPGLSSSSPLLSKLKRYGVPVFSEIETAMAFAGAGQFLAVTGTNGKTTTTLLLGEIMRRALAASRGKALVCGNVGVPAAAAAAGSGPRDAVVMEVSSYQLEDSSRLRPDAAALLNITPDHLEHHGGMAAYIAAKARVFRFQEAGDACVFNADDANCLRLAKRCRSRKLFFSSSKKGGRLNAWIGADRKIALRLGKIKTRLSPPPLPGRHNLENAMCAALMASSRGVKPAVIQAAFSAFRGVEHRIEPAGRINGMAFINDSKATNVESTLVALEALRGAGRKIWLILGGLDKGSPYSPLIPAITASVKAVLTIGAAAGKIEGELGAAVRVLRAGTLRGALSLALSEGKKGDTVLLSPACASFDQFRDFEDRGRRFKTLVRALKDRRGRL